MLGVVFSDGFTGVVFMAGPVGTAAEPAAELAGVFAGVMSAGVFGVSGV
jgi:hypothetical protein